ncbi:peptide/nickel transport system substrate-binding protein [Sinosporangium album]|uniref:Peptide/nickel transport system substrate-binding protein n=1 Tax=Sinosporangium album TaxID=504805 RepID=A0A1G8BZG7_9ACTN|nr:ABC transporter substrate-binding protein [Sinosporangium album]SDH38514.1 peptide/nickel transport system substrate-binding protein [Sinosporangium album]
MTRRILRGIVGVSLAATLTAACGAGDSEKPAPAQQEQAGGPQGTLKFGTNQKLDDWEPLTKANEAYLSLVYEGLIELAPDGITLKPRLATEWTQDNTKVEFTLREGVVFHDGTPFDADAVVANLERVRNTPNQWQSMMNSVEKITAVDKTHVRVDLKRAAPNFLPNIARRGALMVSPKALKDGSFKTTPAGTGPWTLQAKESTTGFKTVVSFFDKYYAPDEVGPRRIEMTFINEPDSLYNSLRSGQVDIAWTNATIAKRAETEGFKSSSFPSVMWSLLMMDTKGTFQDPKLRQAMCYALNPKDFIDTQLGGISTIHTQRLREGQEGYDPNLKGYPHDVAKAKELMKELGNPEVSFTFPAYDSQRQVADLFRSQMAAIGIDAKIEIMQFAQYFSVYRSGKYPIALLSGSSDTGAYDYYLFRFQKDGPGNPYKTSDAELDKAVERALAATEPKEQEAEWKNMMKSINDEALDCGFFEYTGFWAYDAKKVDNIVNTVGNVATFRYKEARVLN